MRTRLIVSILVSILLISSYVGILAMAEEGGGNARITRPEYKSGDFWKYKVNNDDGTYTETHTVESASGEITLGIGASFTNSSGSVNIDGSVRLDGGNLAIRSQSLTTTMSMITIEMDVEYDPPLEMYHWDLEQDDSWNAQSTMRVTTTISGNETEETGNVNIEVRVKELETVTVPAGEFKALRIEMNSDGHTRTVYWSADVGNVVKEEEGSDTKELTEFKCDEPGDLKEENFEIFDMEALGMTCLILPLAIGLGLGLNFGAMWGISSGWNSEIEDMPRRRGGGQALRSGPKFCPTHGKRTEKRAGVMWCDECGGSPMMTFRYCPNHGARLKRRGLGLVCIDCKGDVKW